MKIIKAKISRTKLRSFLNTTDFMSTDIVTVPLTIPNYSNNFTTENIVTVPFTIPNYSNNFTTENIVTVPLKANTP